MPRGSARSRRDRAPPESDSRRRTAAGSRAKIGLQPPSASLTGFPPSHGRAVLALRPACASCIAGTAPCALMNRKIRASISMCSSFQIPRSCGLIRPSGSDRRRLGEDEAGAADRAAAEMHQVPVVREAVLARILAHRRDDDAVAKLDSAQAERRKQVDGLVVEHGKESHTFAALAGLPEAFEAGKVSAD